MKTNETSTTRQQAMAWWKQLCLSCELDDTHYVLDSLIRKYCSIPRHYQSLTGREIEKIWLKETEHGRQVQVFNEFMKPNQKQFKQFDESLHKAYLNKFSDEDKFKAFVSNLNELSKETQFNAFLATLKKMNLDSQTQSNIMTLVALRDI